MLATQALLEGRDIGVGDIVGHPLKLAENGCLHQRWDIAVQEPMDVVVLVREVVVHSKWGRNKSTHDNEFFLSNHSVNTIELDHGHRLDFLVFASLVEEAFSSFDH